MAISVLATKCRFCGEEVGKPKEETRELSINDLGGENIQHRAPSGSVMEALESFRVEDADGDATGMDLNSLGGDVGGDLDAGGGFNVSSDISDVFKRGQPENGNGSRGPSSADRLMTVLKVAVVLGVVIGGGIFLYGWLEEKWTTPAPADEIGEDHRAENLIASGGAAIEALALAVEASNKLDNAYHRQVVGNTTKLVMAQIRAKLNANPWTPNDLNEASELATQLVNLNPNSETTRLKDEVHQDTVDYRLAYMGPTEDGRAKFRLNRPGTPLQEAGEGSLLANRFRITDIIGRRQVKMVDEKRGNRSLVCELGLGPQ
jgi:hypothetical protein